MPEAIQFHCPACGITLRVPLAASGTQGPCPRCQQSIICPDIGTGIGAHRADLPLTTPALAPVELPLRPSRDADPFNPFHRESSPLQAPEPGPELKSEPAELPAEPTPAPPVTPAVHLPSQPFSGTSPGESLRTEVPALTDAATILQSDASRKERQVPHSEERSSAGVGAGTVMVLLLLFSLLAALVGFVAGYGIGTKNAPAVSLPAATRNTAADIQAPPTAPSQPSRPEPVATPPAPPTPPEPSPPAATLPPPVSPVEDEQPSIKVMAAPEAALKAFLSAPDWRTRAKHVLHPARVAEKMEAYHADTPDSPTVPLSLTVNSSYDDPESGEQLYTYIVCTEDHPKGFPVAIAKTPDGWKVDWESFVEFRDDHFRRFASGEGSDTGSFHLWVRNTHYFDEKFPGSDKLTAFRVDPPLLEREQYAFAPTGSDLQKSLSATIEWGRPCAVVLHLARKQHPDGSTHLEITGLAATDWRPQQ